MSLLGKQSGPKLFVRLSKVSALEDVRLRQVLLYSPHVRIKHFPTLCSFKRTGVIFYLRNFSSIESLLQQHCRKSPELRRGVHTVTFSHQTGLYEIGGRILKKLDGYHARKMVKP